MSSTHTSARTSEVTRRGFVTGASVATAGVVAGLAARQAHAEEATTNEGAVAALAQIKPAIGHVIHNQDLCSGCRTCEIVCAVAHEGVAEGVDGSGNLLVRKADGALLSVSSGEAHLA